MILNILLLNSGYRTRKSQLLKHHNCHFSTEASLWDSCGYGPAITKSIIQENYRYHNPGTWHDSSQVRLNPYFGTAVPVSLGNNHASLLLEQLWQRHLGTIVSVSLGNSPASVSWEQSRQPHFVSILLVSLESNRANFTLEKCCSCHLMVTNRDSWRTEQSTLTFFP